MEVLAVVVMLAFEETQPVPIGLTKTVAECHEIAKAAEKSQPNGEDVTILCIPMPKGARVTTVPATAAP